MEFWPVIPVTVNVPPWEKDGKIPVAVILTFLDVFARLFHNQTVFQKPVWYFFDQVARDAKNV